MFTCALFLYNLTISFFDFWPELFLFRWDDGKKGIRRLVLCRSCNRLYLVQSYYLHKFSQYKDVLFEDWYPVGSEKQADYWNRTYTGIQMEHKMTPAFRLERKSEGEKI